MIKPLILILVLVSSNLAKNIVNKKFVDYLVGGTAAKQTEFPHAISLRYKDSHTCGGSLISSTRVLTAAHCVVNYVPGAARNVEDLTVVTGSDVLTPGSGTTYKVKSVHPHNKFKFSAYRYDVGVVELERPVEFSDKVQIVPLPEGSEVPDGASLQVSGFGIYRSQRPIMGIIVGSPLSSYLRKLDVTTISKTECQKTWDEKRPSYGVKITDDHLCTSTDVDTKGYCNGDSGSGVLYNGKVVGIVSFGDSICANGAPDVATRVGYYLDFISQHLN